jgi:hypothetical protein
MYGSRQLIPLKLPKITQVNLTYPVSILGSRKERKGQVENTPPTVSRLSLICTNTGSFPRNAKADGK